MAERLRIHTFLLIVLIGFIGLIGCDKEDTQDGVYDPNPPDPPAPPEFSIPETKDIIMYEVNIRAFGPGSDFQAVIDRLDEIEELSVNVLWLMPIHPIGTINSVNSPYSVQDYEAVNPEFGSLDDLTALIQEAHDRNMAVILDWVANHTSWDHPWIENKDWYTQDGSGNIIHPPGTNWMDVADLNFDNEEMRQAMIDALKYWVIDVGVDGFRCDAADFVPFDFWEQALDSLRNIPGSDLILLAEGARKDHYTAGFALAFSWEYYSRLKDVFNGVQQPKSIFIAHQSEYNGIPSGSHRLRFTTNHDESAWDATPVELYNGIDGALAASVITTFMGGVPMMYSSQEVGVADPVPFFSQSTIDWSQNPEMFQDYQTIMEIYASSDAAKSTELMFYEHPHVVAFRKERPEEELFVVVNTKGGPVAVLLDGDLANSSWTNAVTGIGEELGSEISLDGYEYRILQR